uniref:Inactive tyrosine-protein kinase 7 n=1 Tax=Cacopsylla melanoneura TaxID=428564 RepID=A0A8D9F466_9HEMI
MDISKVWYFWTSCSLLIFGITQGSDETSFKFLTHPQSSVVVEGHHLVLECVGSNPAFKYSWTQNGAPLIGSYRKYVSGSDLIIRRADRHLDEGKYACVATSPDGDLTETSEPATVTVHWIRDKVEVQLVAPDSKDKISAGHDVTLRCHVEGIPDVKVEWYRNGERLSKTDKHVTKGKKLHVKNVNPNDNGVYRCVAINTAGVVNSEVNFVLRLTGTKWAEIQTVPQDKVAVKGSAPMFHCQYTNYDVLEWYFHDTGPLTNSSSFTVYKNGSLVIHNVDASKEGQYSCVGIKADSPEPPQTFSAQLSLAYLDPMNSSSIEPTFDSPYRILAEHSHSVFHCIAPQGRPTPKVTWWGGPHNTSLPSHDGKLTIKDASLSRHAGYYSCVAENLAGSQRAGFSIIVTAPPVIMSPPQPLTVDEGTRAVLRCIVSSAPYPATEIRWKKGETILPLDSAHTVSHLANGTLVINDVEFGDRGEYVCMVNTTGHDVVVSRPAMLQVIEKLKFSPKPGPKKLELGSNDKIHCKAKGAEQPIIKWARINSYGDLSTSFPSHIEDVNGTLHINGVTMQDKGKYVCTASNSEASINVTIDVDVVISPKFTVVPEDPIEAYEGYSIMINCAAEGLPQPNLQWDKNANMNDFDRSRIEVLQNGSLFITEVHRGDEGKYGCTAGNIKGLKRVETTLIVRTTEGFQPRSPDDLDPSSLPRTMAITLSIAAGYLLLVFGLMAWCRARRRKRKLIYLQEANNGGVEAGPADASGVNLTQPKETLEMRVKDADGTETAQSASSNQSKRSGYDKFAFDRRNLSNMMLLGSGEFGDVYLVQARGLKTSDPEETTVLMAKSLVRSKDDEALHEFKREIDLFSKVDHAHVVKMIGICRDGDPHYLLLEYTDWGDLKQFLLATRKDFKDKGSQGKPKVRSLSSGQAVTMVLQAALGLEAISEKRFIHKDVAARNVLISSDLSVKISLSGLSQNTYQKEYYKYRNAILPLRWLPYEAVFDDEFSTKSDVYSFGCLMWEIFNKGEWPFPDLTDEQVLSQLESKKLSWKHSSRTPEYIVALHEQCTHSHPHQRLTFSSIVTQLRDVMVNLNS